MTALMVFSHRRLPWYERYPLPPRIITMQIAQRLGARSKMSEPQRRALTLGAHYSYGASMGALYGAASTCLGTNGVLPGMAFGMTVWAGSYLGLLPALRILTPATEHPVRRNALMIAAHLLWGGVLGALTRPPDATTDEARRPSPVARAEEAQSARRTRTSSRSTQGGEHDSTE